jgi:hypothetical protein
MGHSVPTYSFWERRPGEHRFPSGMTNRKREVGAGGKQAVELRAITHLSDDRAVAKMGHPGWWREKRHVRRGTD